MTCLPTLTEVLKPLLDRQGDSPEVAVICAWYNRSAHLSRTLDSLLASDFDSFCIVVINDGSTDINVKARLDGFKDPRLIVVHQQNQGFTKTIAAAIEAVRSPYVCIMGAGDVVTPDKIRKQYRYLEKYPSVSALGCGHYLISATSGRNLGYKRPVENISKDMLRKRVPFTQGTVMYRRLDLLKAGSYDAFFKYSQDWDVYSRLVDVGMICALNEPLYEKYIYEDGASFSPNHNIAQSFYSRLAREQDRVLIDYYKNNPEKVAKYLVVDSARHIYHTLKNTGKMIVRREWRLAVQWGRLLVRQVISGFLSVSRGFR